MSGQANAERNRMPFRVQEFISSPGRILGGVLNSPGPQARMFLPVFL